MANTNDLLNRINKSYSKMSKGQKLLAAYISDNYDRAVFLTAAKMGDMVGVSESTVVRFAMSLGYKGYPEFQKALEELVHNKLHTTSKVDVTYGRISANAFKAQKELKESKINCAVIKLNLIYPFSEELINTLKKYRKLYFFEEGVRSGGIAEHLISRLENEIDFKIFAIEDAFVPSAKIDSALKKYKLDSESMYSIIKGEL